MRRIAARNGPATLNDVRSPRRVRHRRCLSDDAPNGRIDRRDALKKAAAVGGALWIAPVVQSVNMTKAWAAVGSDPESDPGPGQGPAPIPGPGSNPIDRYTVRFDIGRRGARCSVASAGSCRCLSAERLAGGCSFARAQKVGSDGRWKVTVSGQGAYVVEGFSLCAGHRSHRCDPGSPVGANKMIFRAHRDSRTRRRHGIVHIEVTFVVPRRTSGALA